MYICIYISSQGSELLSVCVAVKGKEWRERLRLFPLSCQYILPLLMSERLAPSARGGLSPSDGFPGRICQVRACTVRRSPLLSRVIYYLSPPPAALRLLGCCQQRRWGTHQGVYGLSTKRDYYLISSVTSVLKKYWVDSSQA